MGSRSIVSNLENVVRRPRREEGTLVYPIETIVLFPPVKCTISALKDRQSQFALEADLPLVLTYNFLEVFLAEDGVVDLNSRRLGHD